MVTIDQNVVYLLLLFVFGALLLAAGALYLLRAANKDVRDGTPPDIVNRLMDFSELIAKLLAPGVAGTQNLTDDELLIKFMEARGYTTTGSPETGYTFTKEPVDEASG